MDYERFAPLVTPHTATITRMAAALVGIPDAEDAAQESLMRAWRAWPGLREADSTRAWLLQITVNVCRTWRARSQSHGGMDHLDTMIPVEGASSITLGASDHVNALDMRQALLTLSDDLRQIIALRFYIGMDSTEIGELLKASPATIRTRLRRALFQLRRALDDGRQTIPAHETPARKDA
ncbi:MAG TPA: sigma-70 family RNA polymerase sigma factor [Ktedonobacterales bacterium]|nr:sigma-70 family RNA polymerase sigma factor [Ktedonobacterales bacterium]